MRTTEQATKRPFHETIIDAIGRASSRDLECLGALILETSIPKGHDEIIAAWEKRREELGWMPRKDFVRACLLQQKQEAVKKLEPAKSRQEASL